jgi:AraC family transcriptional regulator of adaptative response / DNA-3-methyladenine glycosylase II
VRAIIGQQGPIQAANAAVGRLVERIGTPVAGLWPFGLTHTFPAPRTVAQADLSGLGVTDARAETIRDFARAVDEDTIRLDRSVSLDRLISSIKSIDGLRPWSAHYLAYRMGEPDAWPAPDSGLRRALSGRLLILRIINVAISCSSDRVPLPTGSVESSRGDATDR